MLHFQGNHPLGHAPNYYEIYTKSNQDFYSAQKISCILFDKCLQCQENVCRLRAVQCFTTVVCSTCNSIWPPTLSPYIPPTRTFIWSTLHWFQMYNDNIFFFLTWARMVMFVILLLLAFSLLPIYKGSFLQQPLQWSGICAKRTYIREAIGGQKN